MADLKVTFPEPCSEPWEGMSGVGCNRHCTSCDRIVRDLSKLTVNDAEKLLDSGERVCVRAQITPDGKVLSRSKGRAVIVSASAILLAACQTTPGGAVENGFHLSGQIDRFSSFQRATISNSEGDEVSLRIGMDGRFDVRDLQPGSYTVRFYDYCGEPQEVGDIVISDRDLALGRLDYQPNCIIVGHMEREPESGRG